MGDGENEDDKNDNERDDGDGRQTAMTTDGSSKLIGCPGWQRQVPYYFPWTTSSCCF